MKCVHILVMSVFVLGGYRIMRAEHPYRNNSIDIEEFDRGIGEVTHFAVFYEYLFAVVSVDVYLSMLKML